MHARSLDAGRSPGSRVIICSRLLAFRQWHVRTDSPRTVAGAAALSSGMNRRSWLSRFSPCPRT